MLSMFTDLNVATQKRVVMVMFNCVMVYMWSRVLWIFAEEGWESLSHGSPTCDESLRPMVLRTLKLNCVEVLNAIVGLTRSNPLGILLFCLTRWGLEHWVPPRITCGAWQHLYTILFWAVGDVVRLLCFALDGLFPESTLPRTVRYTVGPILFPLGTLGELLMVIRTANEGRPIVYIAAALWPAGFYPLMKTLLKQRRKHFSKLNKPEIKRV